MSRSGQSVSQKIERIEPFEDRVDMLFEELAFAIQWDRPSLLLVFYESEYVRADVELALGERLTEIEQQVVQIPVDEKKFDIPLLLSQRSDRGHSVYSITCLSRGGGKEGANAYRALNIRRELFVDRQIRVIFWLNRDEATELARHAPDFWAFRHRVVEFNDASDLERIAITAHEIPEYNLEFSGQQEEFDKQISMCEALLSDMPKTNRSVEMRLDLIFQLATLYQAMGEIDGSTKRLKQGIELARSVNDTASLARFWERLGLIYQYSNKPIGAVRAIRKAIRIVPKNASGWISLGHVYQLGKRLSDAIITYQQAIKIDPQNVSAHLSLIACYRLLGKDELAEEQIKLATPIMENESEYNKGVFESVCGNVNKAFQFLAIALEKKQAGFTKLQRDPNLDFIRNDPRFQQLLQSTA